MNPGRHLSADFNARSFHVVLHDVAPRFSRQIAAILDALFPVIGTRIGAAVVPCWHGTPITDDDTEFIGMVRDRFDEVLLHGFTHSRANGGGLVSRITGGADEMNGLSATETEWLLERGQAVLKGKWNAAACGFIAPTFAPGRLTPALLARHGLKYDVGFRHIDFADGSRIPIATWCWDMGRWGPLGHAGHFYGNTRMRLYRNLLPCLAIHPVDVERGFLPKIVTLAKQLVAEGREPIQFGDVSG